MQILAAKMVIVTRVSKPAQNCRYANILQMQFVCVKWLVLRLLQLSPLTPSLVTSFHSLHANSVKLPDTVVTPGYYDYYANLSVVICMVSRVPKC